MGVLDVEGMLEVVCVWRGVNVNLAGRERRRLELSAWFRGGLDTPGPVRQNVSQHL